MKNLAKLFDDGSLREYKKGQIVLYQGEKTQDVFMIESGYIKIYDISSSAREKISLILGEGDIFPLIWTFKGSDSLLYFYETLDDTKIKVIDREKLIQSIKDDHTISNLLLIYFVERTRELMVRLESIESNSALHKIAQVFVYLNDAHGEKIAKDTYKIKAPLTHQNIADMAGITRETCSIQIKELDKQKAIHLVDDEYIVHQDRIIKLLNS